MCFKRPTTLNYTNETTESIKFWLSFRLHLSVCRVANYPYKIVFLLKPVMNIMLLAEIYQHSRLMNFFYRDVLLFFLEISPGMMMYDDFTNEDFGNIIMDAEDREAVAVGEDYNVASFRSIQPQERSRRRKHRNRRARNKSKFLASRRRPGNPI